LGLAVVGSGLLAHRAERCRRRASHVLEKLGILRREVDQVPVEQALEPVDRAVDMSDGTVIRRLENCPDEALIDHPRRPSGLTDNGISHEV